MSESESPQGERGATRAEPVMSAFDGSSRVSAIAVTLLPQPDSPTRASTSRSATVKLTWSAASTGPSSVRNRTLRSATSSSGPPTVERRAVAQAVPGSLISRSSD